MTALVEVAIIIVLNLSLRTKNSGTSMTNAHNSKKCYVLALLVVALFSVGVFADIIESKGKMLLKAIYNDDMQAVQKIIEKHPELINALVLREGKRPDVYPLYYAISRKHKEIAELLIRKGANPDAIHKYNRAVPLHCAVWHGYVDIITLLVKYGANPNGHPESHYAPIVSGNAKTAELLIDLGADVNFTNKNNSTPLHFTAKFANMEVAEVLISQGANVNVQDDFGLTPLHHAAVNCNVEFINMLVEHGADINIKSNKARTPLKETIIERTDSRAYPDYPRFYETIKLLLSNGSEYAIEDAVRAADMEKIKKLLNDNPNLIHSQDYWRDPLLFCAIRSGHSQVVEYLIHKGADINQVGRFEEPPLHAAAYAGNPETLELLLRSGANVNQRGPLGELALHWVPQVAYNTTNNKINTQGQYNEIVRILIDSGSELNTAAKGQKYTLCLYGPQNRAPIDQIEHQLNWLEIVNKPVQKTAPPWLAFGIGDTALHTAARWGQYNMVHTLIEAGADVDSVNIHGQTPLHFAIAFQHNKLSEYLIKVGADPLAKMNNNIDALQLASKVNDEEIMKLLK